MKLFALPIFIFARHHHRSHKDDIKKDIEKVTQRRYIPSYDVSNAFKVISEQEYMDGEWECVGFDNNANTVVAYKDGCRYIVDTFPSQEDYDRIRELLR